MPSIVSAHFKLHKPCKNCPFRKVGAIELAPGRFEGIVKQLVEDDHSTFLCHETVHNERSGGDWSDEGEYSATGRESMCAGAMILLEKLGRPTVAMRLGRVLGEYDPARLEASFEAVIEPPTPDNQSPQRGSK
ncbi:hypothetical protein ACTHR6_24805 [Ralstonia holmesii]|uniref:hypothetical protein n=1 Tax=Ralstonia TaxID=48736 RepID=UPI00046879AC|nr:hypothetical protein [Ralstonia pickettii]